MPTIDDVDARAAKAAKTLAAQLSPPSSSARPLTERAMVTLPVRSDTHFGPGILDPNRLDPYEVPPGVHRRSRWTVPAAAAAVLALMVGVLAFDAATDERSPTITSTAPTSTATTVRSIYDSGHVAIFSANGEPHDVAEAYLRSRFPDFPAPNVRIDSVSENFPEATAQWSTSNNDGRNPADLIAQGTILLRRNATQWSVVRATTDGVDMAVTISSRGRIQGRVTSSNTDNLAVDVLDLEGNPVPGSPHPTGYPGMNSAHHRFGTAGMGGSGRTGDRQVDIDLPASTEPVVLRAELVGGTTLSIEETVLDTTPAGTVVSEGTWKGGTWKLLDAKSVRGIEGSPCGWILVNGFRGTPSCGTARSSLRVIHPAGTFEGETLYFAYVGPEVRTVRLTQKNGLKVEAEPIADPQQPDGPRSTVLRVPSLESVETTLIGADGRVIPQPNAEMPGPGSTP